MEYNSKTHYICFLPQVLGRRGSEGKSPPPCACICWQYDVCEIFPYEHLQTIKKNEDNCEHRHTHKRSTKALSAFTRCTAAVSSIVHRCAGSCLAFLCVPCAPFCCCKAFTIRQMSYCHRHAPFPPPPPSDSPNILCPYE